MIWMRLILAALVFTAVCLAQEEVKKAEPAEAVAPAVSAALAKQDQPEAQKRQSEVEDEDEEEDQIALESTNIEEKDGTYHAEEQPQSYAAPPQPYAAPAPAQPYVPSPAQSQPIPVPLPIPVLPGSVVLPTVPKQQPGYPAPAAAPAAPVPAPQYPTQGRQNGAYQQPPSQPAYPQQLPPQPAPQQTYAPQPVPQQPYAQPQQQQVYEQPPPPPPPAQLPPQPAYPQPPQQPVYQQPPPPPPPAQYPQQPAYKPQPPAPLPQPSYVVVPQQPQQLQQQPNHQLIPPAAPQPVLRPLPQPAYPEQVPQQPSQPEVAPAVAPVSYPAVPAAVPSDPWPAPAQDMPKIVALDVKCEKNLMKVNIEFDKPFYGIIFSKGHYANNHCVYVPAGLGRPSASFDVSINSCGTTGNTENGLYGYGAQSGSGTFFENTIIIQYDPQVQEVWDQARKLRCTWHDQYEKSITFRPFAVDMLDVVRADFAGDNVGCWMQIQVGKGPWASEVSGLVKIGQTMTMVLAIKDDENKFDMMVRNCMAHDGKRAPIQLVDQRGCVTRPKLMSRFTKIKNFGASASVLSYAHFQAFKFPDSMEVHFQCTIQICRYQCPDQCSGDSVAPQGIEQRPGGYSERSGQASPARPRGERLSKRDVSPAEKQDVGINRIIQVVSTGDLTFALEQTKDNTTTIVFPSRNETDGLICMSSPGFAATLVVLLGILIVSCLLSAFLCIRHRSFAVDRSLVSAFSNPAFAHKKGHF